MFRQASHLFFALLVPLAISSPAFADVITVDDDGPADFAEINAAVASSQDGDTVLVKSGTYSSVPILGRVVDVIADDGATVLIEGYVGVVGLPAGRSVLLSGLQATAALDTHYGLFLQDNAGSIRVQDCSFEGFTPAGGTWDGSDPLNNGRAAMFSAQSADVSLVRTTARGGDGQSTTTFFCLCFSGDGGHALEAQGSKISLYDCQLTGGNGGTADYAGGGGDGVNASSSELFISGGSCVGGDGGLIMDIIPLCNDGGDGIQADASTTTRYLDVQVLGGARGWFPGNGGACADGALFAGGGNFLPLLPTARGFSGDTAVREGNLAHLSFTGEPGDLVLIAVSPNPGHTYISAHHGVWLLHYPARIRSMPLGVIDSTGTLQLDVMIGLVSLPQGARNISLQPLHIGSTGQQILGPPHQVVVLDSSL